MRGKTITKKILFLVVSVSLVSLTIFGAITVAALVAMRNSNIEISGHLGNTAAEDSEEALTKLTADHMRELARNKAEICDLRMQKIPNYTNILAEQITDIYNHPHAYMPSVILPPDPKNEGRYSAQLLYAENTDAAALQSEMEAVGNLQNLLLFIPNYDSAVEIAYIGTESGLIAIVDKNPRLKAGNLDPRTRAWYIDAKRQGSMIWTDVYDDAYGRGLAITCAKPVYSNGEMKAVVGIGCLLESLDKVVAGTKVGESGWAFVLNEKGQMIISPTIRKDAEGRIIRENLLDNDDKAIRKIASSMVRQESGYERLNFNGKDCFIAYEPVKALNWSIGIIVDADEIIKPAVENKANIIAITEDATAKIDDYIVRIGVVLCALFAGIVFTAVSLSRFFSGKLTGPIVGLTKSVRAVSEGNLDVAIDIRTGDEIETLGDAFNHMALSLKEYIADLAKTTAQKQRMETELTVARDIQNSVLPRIFPPFPSIPEIDLFATMNPAKEVGGDFYDFFPVDEKRFCIIIADVSGKGVPAALFMMVARTLIKNTVLTMAPPAEVFSLVNNLLCEGNDAGMFVTAFLGIIDTETGAFQFANAGHNPPIILNADGSASWLKAKRSLVLAGMTDTKYVTNEMQFKHNEGILLYTDGITEAFSAEEALFSDARLIELMNRLPEDAADNPRRLLEYIKGEVDAFALGAEQADDITMLYLRYR